MVVGNLFGSIDAGDYRKVFGLAALGFGVHADGFSRGQRGDALDVKNLVAGEAERFARIATLKFQWHDAHADQVAAVDALVTFRDDRADAQQACALGGPIARRAGAVLFSGDDHEGNAGFAVFHGGVVDGHFLVATGKIQGPATFGARRELIAQANVGKSAADQDFVIATAGSVGIEFVGLYAAGDEIFSGRRVDRNRAGG